MSIQFTLMVTDAVIRVTLAAATFVVGWGLVGFLWATVAGAGACFLAVWLLLRLRNRFVLLDAQRREPGDEQPEPEPVA